MEGWKESLQKLLKQVPEKGPKLHILGFLRDFEWPGKVEPSPHQVLTEAKLLYPELLELMVVEEIPAHVNTLGQLYEIVEIIAYFGCMKKKTTKHKPAHPRTDYSTKSSRNVHAVTLDF